MSRKRQRKSFTYPTQRLHPQEPITKKFFLSGPLPYPDAPPLSQLSIQGKAMELVCQGAASSTVDSLRQATQIIGSDPGRLLQMFPNFDDPLTRYTRKPSTSQPAGLLEKTLQEFAVYRRALDVSTKVPEDYIDFKQFMIHLHSRFNTGLTTFRTGQVYITPDQRGNLTSFPPAEQIESLLQDLLLFLVRRRSEPYLCALVAYVTIIYVHPFSDGNGRTARTLYNIVAAFGTQRRHFVPLSLIASMNPANLLVRLRRVLFDDDWPSLHAFFADALTLSVALQSDTDARAHGIGAIQLPT